MRKPISVDCASHSQHVLNLSSTRQYPPVHFQVCIHAYYWSETETWCFVPAGHSIPGHVANCCVQPDVDEALRLMRMSKQSLHDGVRGERSGADPINAIFGVLRTRQIEGGSGSIAWGELMSLLSGKFSVSLNQIAMKCALPHLS